MSANSATPALTPPVSPKSDHGVRPTTVWFVQGKKANQTFRSALSLYRQDATLHEANLSQAPENEHEVHPEQVQPKET